MYVFSLTVRTRKKKLNDEAHEDISNLLLMITQHIILHHNIEHIKSFCIEYYFPFKKVGKSKRLFKSMIKLFEKCQRQNYESSN